MIELITLGSLDLSAPERPAAYGLLRQPKRSAVLTYLVAGAPTGFVRRDTLLALFWPETDQARGRNALRQTVYQLRRFLGVDAILSRGDEEIRANHEVVACDAVRFEALLAADRPAEALELYRGDFLTGFHVPDAAPELEEWMQSEARRLRALATTAAWSLALSAERRGHASGAASWARRVLELEPLSEHRMADVMLLFARSGNRSGALQAFDDHERRLAAELGAAPAASVQKLAAELRDAAADPSGATGGTVSLIAPPRSPASDTHVQARRHPRRPLMWWAVIAMFALIPSVTLWQRSSSATREPVIALGYIRDASLADSATSSQIAADLLSTSLARLRGVQVISLARVNDVQAQLRSAHRPATSALAASRHLDADYLLEGSMRVWQDGRTQLDLRLLRVRTGALAHVPRAEGRDLFAAIDAATAAVALAFDLSVPRQRISEATTSSVVAYRLYDLGLKTHYEGDDAGAHRLFRAALEDDTAFAMATYYAAVTAPDVRERNVLLRRAVAIAHRATDRERLLIAQGAAQLGMSPTATALADTMAVRYPLDPDAQLAFGDVLQRRGDFLAAAEQFRRVIVLDSLSLHGGARCLACDAYGRLFWSYLHADSAGAGVRVWEEFARMRPSANTFATMAMALARAGRAAEARQALEKARALAPANTDLDFLEVTLSLREARFAKADTVLRRLLHAGESAVRQQAEWYLVLSLRMQGRFREALRIAELHKEPLLRPVVLLEMGRFDLAAAYYRDMDRFMDETSLPGHRAKHRTWNFTHLATSLAGARDTAQLSALADSVKRIGPQSAFGRDAHLHHYIRGLLWVARQEPARAAVEFRKSIWSWSEGYTRANYELARVLIDLNRPGEAVYPLQSALRGDLQASNLYISRTELHELLAHAFAKLGQRDSAAVHYQHVVNAWKSADPPLRARLAIARDPLNVRDEGASPRSPGGASR